MAVQLLANYGKPNINGVRAQLILTNVLLDNIFQGQIESNGKGITQKFTIGNLEGAQIAVTRVKPIMQKARELGATINGGNYPAGAVESETVNVGIDVITVLDTPIDVLRCTTDMIPVPLLQAQIDNFSTSQVNLNLNAITIAGKLFKTLKAEADGEEVNITKVDLASAGLDLAYSFIDANAKLDEGDEANGVSMFPEDDRVAVIQTSLRPLLIKKGVLVIGGANDAYDILRKGTLDAEAKPSKITDGFIGTIDGVDCHVVSPLVLKTASEYLGFDKETIKECLGYISSAFANSRGVNMSEAVKVIPCPVAQGVRLLPFVRMGFASWYAKGNSLLMKDGYVNPYTFLKGLWATGVDFSYRAPGSRYAPEIVVSAITGTGFTATATNAVNTIAYVGSDSAIGDLSAFMKAYNSATAGKKGMATSGVAVSGKTASAYWTMLAIAVDGTTKVLSTKVA